jgi:hypothetical protein
MHYPPVFTCLEVIKASPHPEYEFSERHNEQLEQVLRAKLSVQSQAPQMVSFNLLLETMNKSPSIATLASFHLGQH